jgi:ankyrin repeat protein
MDVPLISAISALKDDEAQERVRCNVPNSDIENFVYSLLNRGASVRPVDENDSDTRSSSQPRATILGAAAALGSYKLTSRLLAEGANPHSRQEWSEPFVGSINDVTPLQIAGGSWNIEFITALAEHYASSEFEFEFAKAFSTADSKGRLPLH